MSSRYCMSCGGANTLNSKFCSKCGKSFGGVVHMPPSKSENSQAPAKTRKFSARGNDEEDESNDATRVPNINQIEFEFDIVANETFPIGKVLKKIVDAEKDKE